MGGFGNLIALPLQGKVRKESKSVFVDKNFIPYSDQWAYLSKIVKMSFSDVEQAMALLCKQTEFGELISISDENILPWESNTSHNALTHRDYPTQGLKVTKSNMLYIEKQGVSHPLLNKIKRLATFKNPEFYKAQALRFNTFNIPRLISLAENHDEYLVLPRGTEENLLQFLKKEKIKFTLEDKRFIGDAIDIDFNGTLREDQKLAVNALTQYETGVLSATTAFGKTVIAANIIANHKRNTLILVHTQALLTQWKKSLSKFLTIHHNLPETPQKRGRKKQHTIIGEFGGGKHLTHGIIDVAIMQSLISNDEVKGLVRNYGQIIVDECHHVSAVNFEKILKFANAKYIYGLTATPTRQDGHHPIIFLQCGHIRHRVDAKSEAAKRAFEHYLIPRFTNLKPFSLTDENQIAKIYNDLSTNESRNDLIIKDVLDCIEKGRNPIILTERTEYIEILSQELEKYCNNVLSLSGKMPTREKNMVNQKLSPLDKNEKFVLVASGKYVGEGFDFPRLDTLFLAMPIAWKGKIAQYAGRLHRSFEGKDKVIIYDYVDIHIPVLEKMYHKRVKSYLSLGYKTFSHSESSNQIQQHIIYDKYNFISTLEQDIEQATKEIVIACPTIKYIKNTTLLHNISIAYINGARINLITKPLETYKENEQHKIKMKIESLEEANIKVSYQTNLYQKFIIIDEQTVWYGSINLFSYNNEDSSFLRLENKEIAKKLLQLL